jgi:hypothetical protein
MERRPVLRLVDDFAAEERTDPGCEPPRPREGDERGQGRRIEALPAEVEQEASRLAREIPEAIRVRGEELGHRDAREAARMAREGISQGS